MDINISVNEDGDNVIQNAKIKAYAYYEKVNMPVIAGDSSLYVDKFENQPGLFVKRVNGNYLGDDDLENYYIEQLNKVGGFSKAHYVTGLVLISNNCCKSIEIREDDFLFTATKYDGVRSDDPLGRLEYDLELNKYFCCLNDEEINSRGYIFDIKVKEFIKNNLF